MKDQNIVVAIHQPNFMPWLGYFHKIAMSDIFIFFDDVQFPRSKSFVNRVLIKMNNGPNWLTIPIKGKSELKPICEVAINYELKWQQKMVKSIELSYKKAKYFDWLFPELQEHLVATPPLLAEFNITLIKFLSTKLGLNKTFRNSSAVPYEGDNSTQDRIQQLVTAAQGNTYVTGKGAGSMRYINSDDFTARNITLQFQEFEHPQYPQLFGPFEPSLSVIDLLFNCGPASLQVLLGGNQGVKN